MNLFHRIAVDDTVGDRRGLFIEEWPDGHLEGFLVGSLPIPGRHLCMIDHDRGIVKNARLYAWVRLAWEGGLRFRCYRGIEMKREERSETGRNARVWVVKP